MEGFFFFLYKNVSLKSEEAWIYNIQILSYKNRALKSLLTSEVNWHADGSLCHKRNSPQHH